MGSTEMPARGTHHERVVLVLDGLTAEQYQPALDELEKESVSYDRVVELNPDLKVDGDFTDLAFNLASPDEDWERFREEVTKAAQEQILESVDLSPRDVIAVVRDADISPVASPLTTPVMAWLVEMLNATVNIITIRALNEGDSYVHDAVVYREHTLRESTNL